ANWYVTVVLPRFEEADQGFDLIGEFAVDACQVITVCARTRLNPAAEAIGDVVHVLPIDLLGILGWDDLGGFGSVSTKGHHYGWGSNADAGVGETLIQCIAHFSEHRNGVGVLVRNRD